MGFRQLYRGCKIAKNCLKKIVLSCSNGCNSKSIELRNFSKVIASCYRRSLQNEKEKRKIGAKLWRRGSRAPLQMNIYFFESMLAELKSFRHLSPVAIAVVFKMGGSARVKKIYWPRDPRACALPLRTRYICINKCPC